MKKEFKLQSSDGKNELAGYHYLVNGSFLKGALVILHGMNEYAGRYEGFIEYLNDNGYAVVIFDQLGHGHSAKSKDDLGYFGEKDSPEFLVKDARLMVDQTKLWYKDVPIILMGHSMGSNIGRRFCEKYPNAISGFIQMGSMGKGDAFTNLFGGLLLKTMALIRGGKTHSKFASNMAFKPFLKRIKDPVTPCDWLSKDLQICKEYLKDDFCNFPFTLRGLLDIMDDRTYVNRDEWFEKLNPDIPLLIISGEEDACGNYGLDQKVMYERLKSKMNDLSLKLYPNDRHEILNETDKEVVFSDILEWLNHLCLKNIYLSDGKR